MRRLVWTEQAAADIFAIGARYDLIDPALSDRLLAEIAKAPTILLDLPYAGPALRERQLRKWVVRSTPFVIVYRPFIDRIEIARVRHVRENWRR